jgi:hypothetical protein
MTCNLGDRLPGNKGHFRQGFCQNLAGVFGRVVEIIPVVFIDCCQRGSTGWSWRRVKSFLSTAINGTAILVFVDSGRRLERDVGC